VPEAVEGLLRGVARALGSVQTDGSPGVPRSLECVTIVELDGRRLLQIAEALDTTGQRLARDGILNIDYNLSDDDRKAYKEEAKKEKIRRLHTALEKVESDGEGPPAEADPAPARLTFSLGEGVYTFGAVTAEASIPERAVEVNTGLVNQTNDLLVRAESPEQQEEYGQLLGQLLIPNELREQFRPSVPLVMQMDATSARIHWEMVVATSSESGGNRGRECPFLGLERGFTRQLRTAFAPPPEPPPAARRILRVLVVADPAPDARLQGALQEAAEVAELFEAFNQVYRSEVRTEVVRLFGPSEANWIEVLAKLFLDKLFDVLHYAGHCFFDTKEPACSGWIFRANPRQVLSARELRRIEHLPRFVFSNACESGVTPERPQGRQAALAPSFAESFFERGVANFVCTAWPVDDLAARMFARQLYAGLLGLELDPDKAELNILSACEPLPLYQAMRRARRAAFHVPSGRRSWGAYQHYGNPHARFFSEKITGHARPHYHIRKPAPAISTGTPPSAAKPSPPPPAGDRFAAVRAAIAAHGDRLRVPGYVEIRPGFKYKGGWSTGQPAVVVVVRQKKPLEQVLPAERIPEQLDGVPVDVAPANPLQQLATTERGALPVIPEGEQLLKPGERFEPAEEAGERRLPYEPPKDAHLDEVEDSMAVLCHVSPDQGWPTLDEFLGETKERLTVGMYDFTAPHITKRIKTVLRPVPHKLQLVLDPGLTLTAGGEDAGNPKAKDDTEDDVCDELRTALGKRFEFVWAAVKHKGKVREGIFPTSYHIKVAVRDGEAFWLSSGNWQSSNQPSDDTLKLLDASWDKPKSVLTGCNREWHLVIQHEGLAKTFERFLQHDFEQASDLQAEAEGRGMSEALPTLLVPPPEQELAERGLGELRRFDSRTFEFRGSRKLRVQPLLTPDNYAKHVLALIKSARKSLYFQNQYINLSKRPDELFTQLVAALKDKVNNEGLDVRIILRDLPTTRDVLEGLESEGFNMDRIRIQKASHTKGTIVDDTAVVVGSHNWSSFGTVLNRDASMILFDKGIVDYFREVFLHDWEGLARSKVGAERNMPVVADSHRGERGIPSDWVSVPWNAVFED
jgi:hypothetical protein